MQAFIRTISVSQKLTQIQSKLTTRVFLHCNKFFWMPFSRSFFSGRQKQISNIHKWKQNILFYGMKKKSNRIFGLLLPILLSCRSLFVQTQYTPNPETMKFIPGLFYLPFLRFFSFDIFLPKNL
jgi:hypothetical protein